MEQKVFSIITPTYNCGDKLERTIQSVLSQDHTLFEYIIVDGGSTDNTLGIIKKYQDRLKLRSEPDKGIYDAMNKGIEMASGRYLNFLGAGDCLRPDILSRLHQILPAGELNFVYGNVFLVDKHEQYGYEFKNIDFIKQKNICHQAIFYARKIFDLVGAFELEYKTHADFAFNLKCFGRKDIRKTYVDHVIADYEGGGLSEQAIDLAFRADFRRLILTRLGFKEWFTKIILPHVAASFRYRVERPLRGSAKSNELL